MVETEFVEVPENEQLDRDPIGRSDANALEGGDDLDIMAWWTAAPGEVVTEDLS